MNIIRSRVECVHSINYIFTDYETYQSNGEAGCEKGSSSPSLEGVGGRGEWDREQNARAAKASILLLNVGTRRCRDFWLSWNSQH